MHCDYERENYMVTKRETLQQKVLNCKGAFSGTAIICGDSVISYKEFDELTDHVSNVLAQRKIGPDQSVVLCMKRTEKLLIAMFGIYKSGAAMVPVAASTPQKRLDDIYIKSKAALILTDIEYESIMASSQDDGVTLQYAGLEDIAQIMFTSGSTGTPKGVCHTQSAESITFCQYPHDVREAGIKIEDFDYVIARTEASYNFTYHVEYPTALLFGKTLIFLREEEQNSVNKISNVLIDYPRSILALTPSQLDIFMNSPEFVTGMQSLSAITIAGEPLTDKVKEKLLSNTTEHTSVLMLYGITECQTIAWSDLRSCAKGGVTMPYVTVVMIDEDNNIVEEGEVCVHSPQMLKYYAAGENVSEISIEGKKYFRTGDRGCMVDGCYIVCKGRIDRMIKYHGQRVELGEIEHYLEMMPEMTKVAVVDAKTSNGMQVIALYYEAGAEVSSIRVREYLSEFLPDYMIPMYQHRMDKIPLSQNGKSNYAELKNRIVELSVEVTNIDNDRTETEQLVIEIVASVLEQDVSKISNKCNMMELGIDSIRAIDLIGRLEKYGYSLSMLDYYNHTQIKEFASYIENKHIISKNTEEEIEKEDGTKYQTLPLQNKWIKKQEKYEFKDGLYILSSFISDRIYSVDELKKRLKIIAKRHPALRLEYRSDADGLYCQWSDDKDLPFEIVDFSHLHGNGGSQYDISDMQRSAVNAYFIKTLARYMDKNLNTANTMFHLVHIKLSEMISAMILVVNHIAVDGTSNRILIKELLEKEIEDECDTYYKYMQYVSNSDNRNRAIEFWKGYLNKVNLSCFKVSPSFTGIKNIETVTVKLPTDKVREFKERCNIAHVSVPLMGTYLYGRALLDVFETDDIVFRALISGRNISVKGIDSIVGCLINEIPVVIKQADSVNDFEKNFMQANEYGFLSEEEIWQAVWGRRAKPIIAPALVTVIDYNGIEGYLGELQKPSYEALDGECYFVTTDDRIELYFHYDQDAFEREFVHKMIASFEDYLLGNN